MSKHDLKIRKDNTKVTGNSKPEMIAVSFQYLTKNKAFNFEHFGKSEKQLINAKEGLLDKLFEITSMSWATLMSMNKKTGFEMLMNTELRFSPSEYSFSKSEKVFVLRLMNDYRIIGFKQDAVLYIIGFDFNYSAYRHE